MVIRVAAHGWGEGEAEDIEAVLVSVANELAIYSPSRLSEVIEIVHDADGPQILYEKSPTGATVVQLSATDRLWAQFSYQFAHELCHFLCHYERTRSHRNPNEWFEESLCEAASLFVLKRMAVTWIVYPPYLNWKSYAQSLADYVEKRIASMNVPALFHLPSWYKQNKRALRANPLLRGKNALVAMQILPLLEANPLNWGAVEYLNSATLSEPLSFGTHLSDWRNRCPKPYKNFVEQVAQLFEITIEL